MLKDNLEYALNLKKRLGVESSNFEKLKMILGAECKIRVKLAYIYADLHLYNTGRVHIEEV